MAPPGAKEELARLLGELKRSRGLSYAELGRACHLSRSSAHRYCNAEIIPSDFATLESIATACGADRTAKARLHRYWSNALGEQASAGPPRAPAALPGIGGGERVPPRPGPGARRIAVVVLAAVLVSTFLLVRGSTTPIPAAVEAELPEPPEPMWAQTPTPLDPGLFGVTVNSSTGAMPTFGVDSVRFWDSHTRWATVEPSRHVFDWSVLDRLVDGARNAGMSSLFTFGGTPAWADPAGPRTLYEDGSRTSAPQVLDDWDEFVKAVVQRYRGRIGGYEVWAMVNDAHFYSGSVETLFAMTRRAHDLIKAADPGATVVCPSMGMLQNSSAQRTLERFAALGGYDYCDVAGVKLYQAGSAEPPETMLRLAGDIDHAFHRAGVHPPIWNTGTSYDVPLQQPLPADKAVDHAVRQYLVGLFAHYRRVFFYNWGGTKIPVVLQPDGGPPTPAALAVEQLRRWLRGAKIRACGQGVPARLPAGVWQCRFENAAGPFAIRWTAKGVARMTAEPSSRTVERLDGTQSPITASDTLDITTRPVKISFE
ncbi:helix-turn-helix domain-containing protein [Amycolatopsis sp. NPDC058986]|uniref:helix-turn-helix domain-containing protein n=1 Tax=unclassified Amycolatopsis TaxID=2618356 RepID=UPI00366D25F4